MLHIALHETFPKPFCTNFGLSLKNVIFGKLKALLARGYMSHTLVLENLPATKWSRYPWSTGVGLTGGVSVPKGMYALIWVWCSPSGMH